MLNYPAEFIFLTVLTLALYWSVPPALPQVRQQVLLVMSFAVVCIVSAPAAVLIFSISIGVWLYGSLLPRIPHVGFLFGAIGLLVVVLTAARLVEQAYTYRPTGIREFTVVWIGLSYVVLKAIMVMVDTWMARATHVAPRFGNIALLNFFFPIAAAGPIERAQNLAYERFAVAFDVDQFVSGLLRFLTGLFKVGFVAGVLLQGWLSGYFGDLYKPGADYSALAAYAFLAINFAHLYFNFSGYIDLALGIGKMLGLRLSENFDRPFAAITIQDFWQRWHVTLGQFVHNYLFFPLAKFTGGRIELSLILAFTVIGLWHEFSWNYLVWGFAQGVGLVAYMRWARYAKKKEWHKKAKSSPLYKMGSWVLTMSYLGWTVGIATAPSLKASIRFTAMLLGVR